MVGVGAVGSSVGVPSVGVTSVGVGVGSVGVGVSPLGVGVSPLGVGVPLGRVVNGVSVDGPILAVEVVISLTTLVVGVVHGGQT